MTEETMGDVVAKQDALYADEPWAKLAVEAGFRPYYTESAARQAFAFCADKIATLSHPAPSEASGDVVEAACDKRALAEVAAKAMAPARDLRVNPLYHGDPAWAIAEALVCHFQAIRSLKGAAK